MPPENERPRFNVFVDSSKAKEHEWKRVDKSTGFDIPKESESLGESSYCPNVDTDEKTAEVHDTDDLQNLLHERGA